MYGHTILVAFLYINYCVNSWEKNWIALKLQWWEGSLTISKLLQTFLKIESSHYYN